jgi:hypothetical protein
MNFRTEHQLHQVLLEHDADGQVTGEARLLFRARTWCNGVLQPGVATVELSEAGALELASAGPKCPVQAVVTLLQTVRQLRDEPKTTRKRTARASQPEAGSATPDGV